MQKALMVIAMGVTCGVVSCWGVGCANHGSYENVGSPKAPSSQGNNQVSQAPASPFEGNWICDSSKCAADEVLMISGGAAKRALSIISQATNRFPTVRPQSVCRVQASEELDVQSQSASRISGSLSNPQYRVLDSSENTHDCQDYYAGLNQAQPSSQSAILTLAKDGNGSPELTLDGVTYLQASDEKLQSLIAAREAADSANSGIAGTWSCVDDACGDRIVVISGDLSAMTEYETLRIASSRQSCRIETQGKLELASPSDPDLLEGSASYDAPTLVIAAQNTDGCDDVIKEINQGPSDRESVSFERDGNQILMINGQRFLREAPAKPGDRP